MENNHILSEFAVPESEIDAALEVGELGKIVIPVEVIGRIDGRYIFRKHKKVLAEGNFRKENAKDMRERLLDKQESSEDKDGE